MTLRVIAHLSYCKNLTSLSVSSLMQPPYSLKSTLCNSRMIFLKSKHHAPFLINIHKPYYHSYEKTLKALECRQHFEDRPAASSSTYHNSHSLWKNFAHSSKCPRLSHATCLCPTFLSSKFLSLISASVTPSP